MLKQPSYEYFGDMTAGAKGATVYYFSYYHLRRLSNIEIG